MKMLKVAGSMLALAAVASGSPGKMGSCSLPFRLTTPEQRVAFERDGYVVMRGLLDPKTVDELVKASDDTHRKGKKEQEAAGITNGNVQVSRAALTPSPFQNVAIFSDVPEVVAELMQLDPATQTLRLVHDFFLSGYILDPPICDWHVDAHGLWPESNETPSPASKASGKDQDGINAWIAIDDMPIEHEGSMALSAGSHRTPWRYDAYRAIGLDGTVNGGSSYQAQVERMASGRGMVDHPELGPRIRLCAMGITAPELYAKCEERKHVLDLRKGDVVFCSRNLFHRTLAVSEAGRKHYQEKNGRDNLYRYTIRYTVGSAQLHTGFSWMEWSMLMNPEIAGWTLDKVAEKEPTYWFPKVWPSRPDDIREKLQALVPQVEAAKEKAKTVQAKLFADVAAAKEAASSTS